MYELNKKHNNGFGIGLILLIICIVFGMLVSCTKDEQIPFIKRELCSGCSPHMHRDTITKDIIKR